ncbi:MAG TPA: energy transducer TonB, partial [Patescibacteria group bacterium]|nr:energy transducer TonB [Patescibacteria group bacterium]
DEVLYLDGTITLPVVVKRVEPVYPPPARLARLEATLRFQVVVDEHGDVIEVIPIKTHPLFEQSAVEALRRWKYRPAMQGGRAVKVYLLVTVEFRLIG